MLLVQRILVAFTFPDIITQAGLSLNTKEILHGKYNEQELYGYLSVIFTYVWTHALYVQDVNLSISCIYLDSPDAVNTWFLERHARTAADLLLRDIKDSLEESSSFVS